MSLKRQTGLTLTPVMWAYVEAAQETGLYGDGTSTVLRSLIMESLRRLVTDRIIAKQFSPEVPE